MARPGYGQLLSRLATTAAALAGALLAAPRPALADLDVALGNGDRVTAEAPRLGRDDVYRLIVPRGALLSVTVKAKKAKGERDTPTVGLLLTDGGQGVVATGEAKDKKVRIKKLNVPESRAYALLVQRTGGGDGTYKLSVKWKSPPPVKQSTTLGDEPLPIAFSADSGSLLTFTVGASKRSDALPSVTAVGGATNVVEIEQPGTGDKKHKQKKLLVVGDGEFTLTIENRGAAGDIKVNAKLKPPKPSKQKLSLTAREVGNGAFVTGDVIDAPGGEINVTVDDDASLAGAALEVPAGAVSAPTALVVGSAPPIVQPPEPGLAAAGPTVFFGPDGQEFDTPVTITLPFDEDKFGGDFSEMRVVERDRRGRLTVVGAPPLLDVDEDAGVVSLEVEHFTAYRVFGPAVPGENDVNADGVTDIVVAVSKTNGRGEIRVFSGDANPARDSDAFAVISDRAGSTSLFPADWAMGDFNGDGKTDLAVSRISSNKDKVFVFFGGIGVSGNLDVTDADIVFDDTLNGSQMGAELHAADIVGGPFEELVMGNPRPGAIGDAILYVGGVGFGAPASSTSFDGAEVDGLFGSAIASGDVDGNGEVDLVVAAPGDPEKTVSVFLQNSSTFFFAPDAVLTGEGNGAFAESLAVGEITGDGFDDVVVGAENFFFVNREAGRVWVFNGGSTFASRSASAANAQIRGTFQEGRTGATLAIGDVTGDGQADLLVGKPGTEDFFGGQFIGRVGLFPGGAPIGSVAFGSAPFVHREDPADQFARSLVVYDVNGDGVDDALVGAPRRDTNVNEGGTQYVFFGSAAFPPENATDADIVVEGRRSGFSLGE